MSKKDKPRSHICGRCFRGFTTPQGLGQHFQHRRRNPACCEPNNPVLQPKKIIGRARWADDGKPTVMPDLPPVEPVKHDAEKSRVDLLPPRAALDVGRVMGYGAQKYAPNNYLRGEGIDPDRLIAAGLRHLFAHQAGELIDAESKLTHLSHAAASILMAIEVKRRRDDKIADLLAQEDK